MQTGAHDVRNEEVGFDYLILITYGKRRNNSARRLRLLIDQSS
jgi:hypothetical protein